MLLEITSAVAIVSTISAGYLAYTSHKKSEMYKDIKAKYDSTKEFADTAAHRILELENKLVEVSSTVVTHASTIHNLKAELARIKEKEASAKTVKPAQAAPVKKNKFNKKS